MPLFNPFGNPNCFPKVKYYKIFFDKVNRDYIFYYDEEVDSGIKAKDLKIGDITKYGKITLIIGDS